MNREIKFRAKRIDNNEWIYGYLLVSKDKKKTRYYISDGRQHEHSSYSNYRQFYGIEVIPETISQYIGKDITGKESYGGDIVEFEDTGEDGYEYKEGFEFTNYATIVFKNNKYTLIDYGESENSGYADDAYACYEEIISNCNYKVIGNIYDTPELLSKEID